MDTWGPWPCVGTDVPVAGSGDAGRRSVLSLSSRVPCGSVAPRGFS